jgi:hypothetical protein
MATYAVKWREPDGQTFVGRLALGRRTLQLTGRPRGEPGPSVDRRMGYSEVKGVRVGTAPGERLDDRPALVVEGVDGSYLVNDAGIGIPFLQELVDRVAALRLTASRKATVVVPLKDGAIERVRALVSQGPPFDPEETPLMRHELLLTPHAAIFVFEAETDDGLHMLLGQLDVWGAAAVWSELIAAPPRLADVAYTWERDARNGAPEAGAGSWPAAAELRKTRS